MHMNVSAVSQYHSRYRQSGKRKKNETEIKKISGFCSLKLYLRWKEDTVAGFIQNCVIWY